VGPTRSRLSPSVVVQYNGSEPECSEGLCQRGMEDASETHVLLSFVGQVRSSVDENLGTLASFMRRLVHSNYNEMIQCDYH
jgi:hypothetical protein